MNEIGLSLQKLFVSGLVVTVVCTNARRRYKELKKYSRVFSLVDMS